MSASKDHWGSHSRTAWLDASRARRCPVCESDSWCQIGAGTHDGVVLCKRVPSPREKTNRDGARYWVHHVERRVESVAHVTETQLSVECANAAVRHAAYSAVLAALRLDERHRANLVARGLGGEEIRANGYRSLAIEGRSSLVRAIERSVGASVMAGVPGVARVERDGRSWWTLKGAAGMVIPSRDLAGRIVALKVRADEANAQLRYSAVSSRRAGGPSAAVNVHVPKGTRERCAATGALWITEGELKADVCTALSELAVIGVPGVSLWASALSIVKELNPRVVVVAFDADWQDPDPKKQPVRDARERLTHALEVAGHRVRAAEWPLATAKGLDDLLLVQRSQRARSAA